MDKNMNFEKNIEQPAFWKRYPVIQGGLMLIALLFMQYYLYADDDFDVFSTSSVAVVRIEGPILDARKTLAWIEKVRQDDSIAGVLLRVDSPGGGVGASQELFEALRRLAATKPLVASMGSTAASGGLMVALPAHCIVANSSTITGSIGVRMDMMQVQGLMAKLGVEHESLVSGKFKDAGSVFQPLKPEERAYLQGVVMDLYEQFVRMVSTERDLPLAQVRAFSDGRVFTGNQALALGLVDKLGDQYTALAVLEDMLKIKIDSKKLREEPKERAPLQGLLKAFMGLSVREAWERPAFSYY